MEKSFLLGFDKCFSQLYTSDRQDSFLYLLHTYDQELIIKLASITFNLAQPLSLTTQPNKLPVIPMEEAVGRVLYWVMEADYKTASEVFRNLPFLNQKVLYYVFTKKMLNVGEEFLLANLPTLYSLDELLASWIVLPQYVEVESKDAVSLNKAEYPFYFVTNKHASKTALGYIILERGKTTSNIASTVVREAVSQNLMEGRGRLFLYYKKDNRWLVITLHEDTSVVIQHAYKTNTFLFDDINIPPLQSTKKVKVERAKYRFIGTEEELVDVFRHSKYKGSWVLSKEVMGKTAPESELLTVKAYDFVYDDSFRTIGFEVILDDTFNPEDFVDHLVFIPYKKAGKVNALQDTYITIRQTKFNGVVINREALNVESTLKTPCKFCGNLVHKNKNGLCSKCYNKLLKIARSNIEPLLVIDESCYKSFTIEIDKYTIQGAKDKVSFTRDYPKKGIQQVLPFNYTEFARTR